MVTQKAPRILIAATASGSGKTTVSCGLMRALINRGLSVQACKAGPDYIDPMFHRQVLGTPSRNLDVFFAGETLVRELVADGAQQADITVIEGVMGYYDGIASNETASTFDIARITETPAILIVDARGRALSIAAEIAGFARFRTPSYIAGIILSRASEGYVPQLKTMIEQETGIPVLGYVPTLEDANLKSRHLGLIPANEVNDLQERVDLVARTLAKTIDLDALVELAQAAPDITYKPRVLPKPIEDKPIIALAYDDAFSFYYDDTLALMEQLGACIARFSPLADKTLPKGSCGLYLGGGYPELHAAKLSSNIAMLETIREAIASGMPTIAECGGFMYLHETMEDTTGTAWPMVGSVAGSSYKTDRLGRFGYCTITARTGGLLADTGQSLPAHEFHYWDSTNAGNAFHAQKPHSSRNWDCVMGLDTLYAGYPHLYLYAQPQAVMRYLKACQTYALANRKNPPL